MGTKSGGGCERDPAPREWEEQRLERALPRRRQMNSLSGGARSLQSSCPSALLSVPPTGVSHKSRDVQARETG